MQVLVDLLGNLMSRRHHVRVNRSDAILSHIPDMSQEPAPTEASCTAGDSDESPPSQRENEESPPSDLEE